MIKLLVLGFTQNENTNFVYRGIDRINFPTLSESLAENNEVNEVFDELQNVLDYSLSEGHYIKDINLANKISKIYSNNRSGEVFEVLEIVYPFENPKLKSFFLGFDIVIKNEGYASILFYIFSANDNLTSEQVFIRNKFIGKINKNLLFPDIITAFDFYINYGKLLEPSMDLAILGVYQ